MNKSIPYSIRFLVKLPVSIILVLLLATQVFGLVNPASSYCNSLGYTYIDGKCKISETELVDAWDFLKGKSAQEYSFCAKQGNEIKTIKDKKKCAIYGTDECAVCIIQGIETEVSEAMKINFKETSCGDRNCGIPENSLTCPQDCPKGGFDMYCDEGVEDPDCVEPITEEMILNEYKQSQGFGISLQSAVKWVLYFVAVVGSLFLIYFVLRKLYPQKLSGKKR